MDETKVIYHIDDQETPYLVKIPLPSDKVTLLDLKNALNRPNHKFFFKSMDDDFGVVKEEIIDEKSILPSFNGRIITWLVTSESSSSVGDGPEDINGEKTKSMASPAKSKLSNQSEVLVKNKSYPPASKTNATSSKTNTTNQTSSNVNSSNHSADSHSASYPSTNHVAQNSNPTNHAALNSQPANQMAYNKNLQNGSRDAASMMSSDLETTTFIDSDDDAATRYTATTETTSKSTRLDAHKKRRKKHRMPVMSQASSFSSITDSTMSLNIVTIVLDMKSASFLGISIVGQSTSGGDGGIYVGSIMKGGAVAQDGRIEPGDMILEVNGVSFENLSNDAAVKTLRDAVQKPGSIMLVVAKCWDPSPRGYLPPQPVVNGGMWGMGGGGQWRGVGPPSMSSMTSDTTSLLSSCPPPQNFRLVNQSSATSSSSHSSKSYVDLNLTKNADMALVVRAMAQPDSGLDVRDRIWLKISIPHSFIGSDLVDWLYSHVEGFVDRRDARRYACNLLKFGFVQHTVNKLSFSEQCYYVFGTNVCADMSSMCIDDIDSVSSIGQHRPMVRPMARPMDSIGPLPPPPSWGAPPYTPLQKYHHCSQIGQGVGSYVGYGGDGASYISMPQCNQADSVVSGKQGGTCACIVSHTYKQIRRLWDNPDKQLLVRPSIPRPPNNLRNQFHPDIDRSTSSGTEDSESESCESKGSKDGKQQLADAAAAKQRDAAAKLPDAAGKQRDAPVKELPMLPSEKSVQSFNKYPDDTLQVMGEL